MDTRNATGEIVLCVEECGIAVGDLRGPCEHRSGYRFGAPQAPAFIEKLDGPARPARPMTEQTTHDLQPDFAVARRNNVPGQEINDDGIIVARVKRDVARASRCCDR